MTLPNLTMSLLFVLAGLETDKRAFLLGAFSMFSGDKGHAGL